MSSQLISIVATGVLSGGFATAVAQIINARNESRKLRIQEREVAERNDLAGTKKVSIAVEAAERSVTSLNMALNRAEKEIARLEKTVTELTGEVTCLKDDLRTLREDNAKLSEQLIDIRGY